MLMNDIGYTIYMRSGGSTERRARRQSWARPAAERARDTSRGTRRVQRAGVRLAIGHALISLGRAIAAERPTVPAAAPSARS
jgi:hypothetical protein